MPSIFLVTHFQGLQVYNMPADLRSHLAVKIRSRFLFAMTTITRDNKSPRLAKTGVS